MQTTKLASYFAFGAMFREFLVYGLVIGVAAGAASWTGKKFLGRMGGKRFRQLVIGLMVLTGGILLWQERRLLAGWL